MRKKLVMFFLFIPLFLGAIEVTGEQYGTWEVVNNPYEVVGDIIVPEDETLIIEPGVQVVVNGNFRITALGNIIAEGSQEENISFAAAERFSWDGVRLENEAVGSSFTFCNVSDAENGINSINSPLTISECYFNNCEKAVHIFGLGYEDPPEVIVQNSVIENCDQNGIYIVENSNAIIQNNDISNCALDESPRGAIMLSSQGGECSPTIQYNYIHHNVWQGISAWDITWGENIEAYIAENEICYNLTGIYLFYASGKVENNFIHDNFVEGDPNSGAGIMVGGDSSNPIITKNEITGNFCAIFLNNDATANLGNLNNETAEDDGENYFHDNVDGSGITWSIYNISSQDVMAENNQWDSNDIEEIAETIFDGEDNSSFGIVDFLPILEVGTTDENVAEILCYVRNYPNPFNPNTTISFYLE
ncbi:MAG: right-handed parallel beta-helix repeat-containing protein, partial [Candidatus Cloacimonadota bacterium]|nr:right-handed parallel beta-helix repeat-containing protein [Candidatus Cloacimonadota bacterium]